MANLLIPQGDDFEFNITLYHGTALVCPAPISTVPVAIRIMPIAAAMVTGQKLYYGDCGELELSQSLAPTDLIAYVTKVPELLSKETQLRGNPIDVTGWQGFSSVRSDYGSPLAWNFVCTIAGNPLLGTFNLLMPRSVSSGIPANCTDKSIALIEGFDFADLKTWDKLSKSAYVWDFDTLDMRDRKTRRNKGLALVTGEVTL
jgi:hypothetical protein